MWISRNFTAKSCKKRFEFKSILTMLYGYIVAKREDDEPEERTTWEM